MLKFYENPENQDDKKEIIIMTMILTLKKVLKN